MKTSRWLLYVYSFFTIWPIFMVSAIVYLILPVFKINGLAKEYTDMGFVISSLIMAIFMLFDMGIASIIADKDGGIK